MPPAHGDAEAWTPEPFVSRDGDVPFERFVGALSDVKFVALQAAIERVLLVRGIELARTEWLKPLGKGLHEFRVRHDADEIARMFGHDPRASAKTAGRIALRLFVHFFGDRVVLLLNGYDKGRDPTRRRQEREVAEARHLLTQFKQMQRAGSDPVDRPDKGKRRA